MTTYRLPVLRDLIRVNGRTYHADSNGLFWPDNDSDAEEMEKLGAYQDAYPGAWTDLRFPAQAINPAGATAAPSVDTTLAAFPGTLLFSGSVDNVICGVAQMPHEWERGSLVRPHIHWSKPTGSGSVVTWHFYYRHVGAVSSTPGDWVGPVAGSLVAGDQTVSDEHLITSFGSVDMAGRLESSIIAWQVRRIGSTDAEANEVRLYEFDFHYRVGSGKSGTSSEIPS